MLIDTIYITLNYEYDIAHVVLADTALFLLPESEPMVSKSRF